MTEETKLEEMLRLRQAPGVSGLGSGPGRWGSERCFERFHLPTEAEQIGKKMDADGCEKRNPKLYNYVLQKYRQAKGKEHLFPKVDYGKTGHPCMENMGKATGHESI